MLDKYKKAARLFTGRVWLTIISGISFLAFCLTICQILYTKRETITVSETTGIINMLLLVVSNIFTFYFTKEKSDEEVKSITDQLEEKINDLSAEEESESK